MRHRSSSQGRAIGLTRHADEEALVPIPFPPKLVVGNTKVRHGRRVVTGVLRCDGKVDQTLCACVRNVRSYAMRASKVRGSVPLTLICKSSASLGTHGSVSGALSDSKRSCCHVRMEDLRLRVLKRSATHIHKPEGILGQNRRVAASP